MEKKDIKHFLHLYVGCQCQYDNGVVVRRILTADVLANVLREFAEVKPILRPLSSMTEEEVDEIWHMEEPLAILKMDTGIKTRKVVLSPERNKYLLFKGFDVFGLIESGLAIDSTLKPV